MTLFPRSALAFFALAITTGALAAEDLQAIVAVPAGTSLQSALTSRHLTPADLRLRKTNIDEGGRRHLRYRQMLNGLDVIGGDLVVHTDAQGSIFAINGGARGNLPASLGQHDIGAGSAVTSIQADARFAGMKTSAPRLVYLITPEGATFKAYEIVAEGMRGQTPARDKVYVDVDSGTVVGVHPQIHIALNRAAYTASNGTSLPGSLMRSEGQAASSDVDINAAYDNTGDTYAAYLNFFSRDSYNNAGAQLKSTVHYSVNYCNAFWNGTQMVYGDGNAAQGCMPLARSVDVTAHELTHAVTENESGLNYAGESGGLNESFSDIFGAFTEAWVDGGRTGALAISADTWKVGEDVLPPALRYMNDPAADGFSRDYWSTTAGNVDVHYSSGISNLAFYLMSQGGTHPRGKSPVIVTGIGMDKAIRVFYKMNNDILTSTSNFAAAGNASVTAAQQLGYSQAEQNSVADAWRAVGVLPLQPPPPPADTVLVNNVPVTGLGGTVNSEKFFKIDVPAGQTTLQFRLSGGTGDADMYVGAVGTRPTTTSYTCRPYLNGNAETCTINSPAAGTYFVMLRAYSTYSGASLVGVYTAAPGGGGDPILQNGVPVTGISGAASSLKYWRIQPGAGRTLTVRISGGTGDADLYVRFGSRPTTSNYSCRPYTTGNNETCTVTNTQAGDYYIMLRGYANYSGVSLVGSY